MKKFLIPFCACLVLASAIVVSQAAAPSPLDDPPDPTKQIVTEEKIPLAEDGSGALTATLRIEYTPITDEARFYYLCISTLYKPDVAINAIRERLDKFKRDNGYTGSRPDYRQAETKYDNTTTPRTTIYIRYVRLAR